MGDLLYELAQQLRETWLLDLAMWITETDINRLMVTNFWAIPSVQMLHILAIGAAFGSILMMNARVFGIGGNSRTIAETSHRYVPWMWWAIVALVATGLLMLIAEPERNLINPVFWIKMVVLAGAVLLGIWFQKGVLHRIADDEDITAAARAGAALLVILWCVMMLCGRWIAYTPL